MNDRLTLFTGIIALSIVLGLATLVGCDSNNLQDEIARFEKQNDQSHVKMSRSTGCGLGSDPIIFDSFNYSSSSFTPGTSGSLFGSNDWHHCSGSSQTTTSSRMWYRWNHEEPGTNSEHHTGYDYALGGTSSAKLRFHMVDGYDPNVSSNHPAIVSGAEMNHGTYLARVRFSDMEDDALMMQAFWLYSDWTKHDDGLIDTTEYDIEWNNRFQSSPNTGNPKVNVTNHGNLNGGSFGSSGVNNVLDCVRFIPPATYTGKSECLSGNASYVIGEVNPNYNYENEWWTLAIEVDTIDAEVTYSMQNDGYGGVSNTVWAGDGTNSSDFGNPLTISERVDGDIPLNARLGLYFVNDSEKWFTSSHANGHELTEDHKMEVSWFYYIEDVDVDIDDVEDHVSTLLSNSKWRVNTTGRQLSK